ncbi:hypothetical protein KGM_211651 [Danaus plexippus plexippus]|uniref:Uncharacterized protein n=1 Tax=Danaus plexippus plexippus TaxID=278856 RepID=A0A212EHS9_DANPL|nr:hypothetical protein KGM_211651 [Danaus plexippus plexippus]
MLISEVCISRWVVKTMISLMNLLTESMTKQTSSERNYEAPLYKFSEHPSYTITTSSPTTAPAQAAVHLRALLY